MVSGVGCQVSEKAVRKIEELRDLGIKGFKTLSSKLEFRNLQRATLTPDTRHLKPGRYLKPRK